MGHSVLVSTPAQLTGQNETPVIPAAAAPRPFKVWISLSIILAVALGLRLFQIGDHGMFIEELFSVRVATNTGDPELIQFDAIRPVYFWLLHGWMTLVGANELWLRLPSAIFGVVNVGLIYKLGKTVAGPRAGIVAAILAALSPMEIYYSQQVRMYTLGTCLMLCGTLAFVRAWDTSEKRFIYLWAVLRFVTLLTLPLTATLLVADAAIVWWNHRSNKLMPLFMGSMMAVVVGWLPFASRLPALRTNVYSSWTEAIPLPTLSDPLALLINFTCTSYSLDEYKGPPIQDWWSFAYILIVPILLAAAVFASRKTPRIMWSALWLCVPVSALWVWSNHTSTVFLPRYLLFTTPFLFTLLGAGWTALSRRLSLATILTTVYAMVIANTLSFYFTHAKHEDFRQIAEIITARAKPDDQIVMWQYRPADVFDYYYHGPLKVHDLTVEATVVDGVPINASLHVKGLKHINGRTWFIARIPPPGWTDQCALYERYKEALHNRLHIIDYIHIPYVDMYLAEPKPATASAAASSQPEH